jgi:hypothetical protein
MTFRPASHPSVTPAAVPTVTLMVGPTMSVRSYVKYFSSPSPPISSHSRPCVAAGRALAPHVVRIPHRPNPSARFGARSSPAPNAISSYPHIPPSY